MYVGLMNEFKSRILVNDFMNPEKNLKRVNEDKVFH